MRGRGTLLSPPSLPSKAPMMLPIRSVDSSFLGASFFGSGGLAATDAKLVPYGCLTAAFYTALGCLLGPSLLFFIMRGLLG